MDVGVPNTPFINTTTVGSLTTELTIPLVWDSVIRTITATLLIALVSELIIFIHLTRSNAAAAQVVATNGHRGGSLHAAWELLLNRRTDGPKHTYSRRWLLTSLFVLSALLFHASNFVISAYIQQKGDGTVFVSELPIQLSRVSTEVIHADLGCINKPLTYRNGQSDVAVGLCRFFPLPTSSDRNCMGLVRRELDGLYGIYHPLMVDFQGFTSPGTTFIGPMLVSGNTLLFPDGTLPILEIGITEDLVRNMFSDMVEGESTVRPLRYTDISGGTNEGLGLFGNVNVSAQTAIDKLVGGLGFVKGKSKILDPLGNPTTMEVKTSASRTSIGVVIFIGVAAFGGLVLSFVLGKLWAKISKSTKDVKTILTGAVSQVAGSDCVMPAAVANGDVTLVPVIVDDNFIQFDKR